MGVSTRMGTFHVRRLVFANAQFGYWANIQTVPVRSRDPPLAGSAAPRSPPPQAKAGVEDALEGLEQLADRPDMGVAAGGVYHLSVSAWRDGCSYGLRLLVERSVAVTTLELGRNGQLSLMLLPSASTEFGLENRRVVLATWVHAGSKLGRLVHIDSKMCAVYSMEHYHPLQSFRDALVVHPAIGVCMLKPRYMRSDARIPDDILRLWNMWENAMLAQTTTDVAAFTPCSVCGVSDDNCHTCSLCMQTWHEACVSSLLSEGSNNGPPPPLPLPDPFRLPREFCLPGEEPFEGRDPLCLLCAAYCGGPSTLAASVHLCLQFALELARDAWPTCLHCMRTRSSNRVCLIARGEIIRGWQCQ